MYVVEQANDASLHVDAESSKVFLRSSGGAETWACTLLSKSLHTVVELGELVVVDQAGGMELYRDYVRSHRPVSMSVPIRGCKDPLNVRAFLFNKSCKGSFVFWSLPDIHRAMGLQGTPSEWYHKNWKQWTQLLASKFDLPSPPHLRRAVATTQSAHDDAPLTDGCLPQAHERLLPVYTASTHGLLGLVSKWAANTYKHKNKTKRGKV